MWVNIYSYDDPDKRACRKILRPLYFLNGKDVTFLIRESYIQQNKLPNVGTVLGKSEIKLQAF